MRGRLWRCPFTFGVMLLWLALVTLPFGWVILTSLRGTQAIVVAPFGWPQGLSSAVENYRQAWLGANFSGYFANSLRVVLPTLALLLAVATPAAYVFGRWPTPLVRRLFLYVLCGLMVPGQLLLVPLFFQYGAWGQAATALVQGLGFAELTVNFHNSHLGLVLLYVALSLPFTIFILTGFFRTLPGELYEAGMVDGCTEGQAFWHVMLPLARPGLITVTIFNFLGAWNEYVFALVFLTDERLKTLPLGLAAITIQTNYEFDLGMQFAALTIVMLPTLAVYALLQRQLMAGVTLGALKG